MKVQYHLNLKYLTSLLGKEHETYLSGVECPLQDESLLVLMKGSKVELAHMLMLSSLYPMIHLP